MLRTTAALALLFVTTACDGGSPKAKPDAAAVKPADAQAKAPADAKAAEPAADASEPVSSEPPPPTAAEADPLGQRFRDPAWFTDHMFGDKGKKVSFARSEANEAGLFQSHVIFELEEGISAEDCASTLTEQLKSVVELKRTEGQPDDRLQLEGSAERYDVTIVCGEAKGTMRAYVAYEWTR